jgi:biopolymer transport protein TolR
MARNFRRHRQAHAIADLNVTNLIDLAFMLLIIFMVATPLIQQEQHIPVNLPVESVSPQQKADPRDRFEAITVLPDGPSSRASRPRRSRRSSGCASTRRPTASSSSP